MIPPTTQPDPPRARRVALAHDWLVGLRGGERVLDALARAFLPPEPAGGAAREPRLFVLFDDGRPVTPAIDALAREASILNALPGAWRRWLLPLYPMGVRDLARRLKRAHARAPFDLLLSSSSSLVKGLRAPPRVRHVCYCHAPARYLWTQPEAYADPSIAGRFRALGLSLFSPALRRWDRASASNVDLFIANSTHTASEIRRAFDRECVVVHPPVRTEFFTIDAPHTGGTPGPHDPAGDGTRTPREPFWLCVGALEPYKRFDLAIQAAAIAGRDLVVVGEGSDAARLRRLARDHRRASCEARFLGRVSDADLRSLFRRASLLLFPQVEDFGIVALEAQACGLGVIARRAGGSLDTIVDGVTGSLVDEPTPEALARAAQDAPAFDPRACRANAERFSEREFIRGVSRAIGLREGDAA